MEISLPGQGVHVSIPDKTESSSSCKRVAMASYPIIYGILKYLDLQSLQLLKSTNLLLETLARKMILQKLRSCISFAHFRLIGPCFVLDEKGHQKTYWSEEIINIKFPERRILEDDIDPSRCVFRFPLEMGTGNNYLTIWDYFDRLEMIIPRDLDDGIILTDYDGQGRGSEQGRGDSDVYAKFELDKNIEEWDCNVVFEGDFLNDEGRHCLIQRFRLYLRKHPGDPEGHFSGLFCDFVEVRLGFISQEGHWRVFMAEFDGDKLTDLDVR
jgi:hypothetical protein